VTVTIRDALTDPALFGEQFGGESWAAWRALLAGFYGLELTDSEAETWKALTGRESAPRAAHDELWLVVGRRGGKSQAAALMAVYEAAFKDHRAALAPGERATVRVMAADRPQARSVFRYVSGLIESNPMLAAMVTRQDRESIELSNRATIEVGTASYRTARGYTFAAVIADEIAFWRSEDSANPDSEIIAAVRPGLATLRGPLIALSSPYARRGELWETYRKHYGEDSPVLVAQAASRTMNPALPEKVVADAYERDPASAAAEYGGQFRTDVEAFVSREVLDAAMRPEPLEIPYQRGVTYQAFIDPAGGGKDEFTLAIGHVENSTMVVDAVRARTGQPAAIAAEYAQLLKTYRVFKARADKYGGSWPADEFARHGITVEPADQPKSGLYQDSLAALNSERVELPPDDRLIIQFQSLERKTSRAGKDSIDHPPGGHDDRANAVAGLIAHSKTARPQVSLRDFLYG